MALKGRRRGTHDPENEALAKRAARRFGVLLKDLGVLDIREDFVARGIREEELTLAEALKTALETWEQTVTPDPRGFNP